MSTASVVDKDDKLADAPGHLDLNYVKSLQPLYEELVSTFPSGTGKAISKKEREEKKLLQTNLVYGEISFEALGITFEKIKKRYGRPNIGSSGPSGFMQTRGGFFYDLGSGTGKPVIAAAVLHNFDVCVGIEILEGLHTASLELQSSYATKGKAKLARDVQTEVVLLKGDFFNMALRDWRDADVVFANSTCYDEEMMTQLANVGGLPVAVSLLHFHLSSPYINSWAEKGHIFYNAHETPTECGVCRFNVRDA